VGYGGDDARKRPRTRLPFWHYNPPGIAVFSVSSPLSVSQTHDSITPHHHTQEFELVRAGIGAVPE
jgi:hypothetical protein